MKLKLLLICLLNIGCVKTIHVYHHFPKPIDIDMDAYILNDYIPEEIDTMYRQ